MPADRVSHFAALVECNPQNELFRFSLAQALLQAGRGDEAEPHLVWCAGHRADWMVPRIALGRVLAAQGRHDEARRCWEEALQLAIDQSHEDPEAELRTLLASLP